MANSSSNAGGGSGDIFDLKKLRQLIELMNEHDLGEVDLKQGQTRVRLRRGGEPIAPIEVRQTGPSSGAPSRGAAPPVAAASEEHLVLIKSPMVGTFYASPSPDAPAFVKVGDRVGRDTTVCIVEAMKVFNEIPAEAAGKVVAVLVETGAPVEFGQPLFKLDPRL
ncbi:MAG TPA: acetyl-CoA carboxylase biotin carboxyl carrier protein [Pirellulales bacterium]|jgi:acetyl-CoA carboxylase biotin carboxyl carrier protein